MPWMAYTAFGWDRTEVRRAARSAMRPLEVAFDMLFKPGGGVPFPVFVKG